MVNADLYSIGQWLGGRYMCIRVYPYVRMFPYIRIYRYSRSISYYSMPIICVRLYLLCENSIQHYGQLRTPYPFIQTFYLLDKSGHTAKSKFEINRIIYCLHGRRRRIPNVCMTRTLYNVYSYVHLLYLY